MINIKLPKSVLNREINISGIKYKTNHKTIKIVNNPINLVLFSGFIKFFIFLGMFIYY